MVLSVSVFIFSLQMSVSLCSKTETLYKRTKNISAGTFSSHMTRSAQAMNHLSCAHQCSYWQNKEGKCNAYSYQNKLCKMAVLPFLEEPLPGKTAESIMINTADLDTLSLYCRGGAHCCRPENNNLCREGEGDCEQDRDCHGLLVCGQDNCNMDGGFWDGTDSCKRRCIEVHPCMEGEGPCRYERD